MKYLLALTLLATLLGCANDVATAQAAEPVTGAVDRTARLGQGPDVLPTGNLILRMGKATAATGQVACLPVEAANFSNLIGFQYTMAFDSAALRFHSVRQLALPGYTTGNFGVRFADRGVVSTLWTDMNIQGLTRPDNHQLYEICFENLQPAGASTTVRFQDGPTRFEVIRKDMQKVGIAYANGQVTTTR